MLKILVKRLRTLALLIFLVCSAFGIQPAVAQADKAPPAFSLAPAGDAVNVATIYETTYPDQKSIKTALKLSKTALKKASGFQGMTIFQSQDGSRVIAMTQWQDLPSFQAYAAAAPTSAGSKSGSGESNPVLPARTVVFEIAKTATHEGATPTIRGKEAIVEFSEFSLKDPEQHPQVLENVEGLVSSIMEQKPSPQSVVLLKSTDNTEVALLANWNCTADFVDMGTPAGFDQPSDDLIAITDTDQRFYNVVKIMPASTKSKSQDD